MERIKISDEVKKQILRGEELLRMCHKMQCEKDRMKRPEPLVFHTGENYDQFAQDIDQALLNHMSLLKTTSLEKGLEKLGRLMKDNHLLDDVVDIDLASQALRHALYFYGITVADVDEKLKKQIEKGVGIFSLCKQLGSNKKDESFNKDIDMSIKLHEGLLRKFQFMLSLSQLGRKLHKEKIIDVGFSDDFSIVTMIYLLEKYNIK